MRIVPVTGGKSVLLVDDATAGTLLPDGSTLAVECGGFDGAICIAHADGTNLRVLVRSPSLGPKWSPDGTLIAYNDQADGPTGNKVFVVDVATGETTFVAEGGPCPSGSTTTRSSLRTSAPHKPLDTNTSFPRHAFTSEAASSA